MLSSTSAAISTTKLRTVPTRCCYRNETGKMEIIRISNIPEYFFERAVLPSQALFFDAPSNALLEIHSYEMAGAILTDTVPCDSLQVQHPPAPVAHSPAQSTSRHQLKAA